MKWIIFKLFLWVIVGLVFLAMSSSLAAKNPVYAELRLPVFWFTFICYFLVQMQQNVWVKVEKGRK